MYHSPPRGMHAYTQVVQHLPKLVALMHPVRNCQQCVAIVTGAHCHLCSFSGYLQLASTACGSCVLLYDHMRCNDQAFQGCQVHMNGELSPCAAQLQPEDKTGCLLAEKSQGYATQCLPAPLDQHQLPGSIHRSGQEIADVPDTNQRLQDPAKDDAQMAVNAVAGMQLSDAIDEETTMCLREQLIHSRCTESRCAVGNQDDAVAV